MKIIFGLVILLLNYKLLYIAPWVHIQGKFNLMDLSLLLTFGYVAYLLFFNRTVFFNRFSFLIFLLLFLVIFHIPYAVLKYSITYSDAIIASRKFFLYLNFFVFLDILKDEKDIRRLINCLIAISIISILLGLINYLGIKVLYNERWTPEDSQVIRSGVERAYFPAYWVIVFTSLYTLARYLHLKKVSPVYPLYTACSAGAIFFRQTRMVIGAYAIVAAFNIITRLNKRKAWILFAISGLAMVYLISNLHTSQIITSLYEKTDGELTETTGTWGARVEQFKVAWELFGKNTLLGSGSSALRTNIDAYHYKTHRDATRMVTYGYSADLGYATWMKNFGLAGLLVLFFLGFTAWKYNRRLVIAQIAPDIAGLINNYFIYVLISFITINHLGHHKGIPLITIAMAILQSLHSKLEVDTRTRRGRLRNNP